MNNLLKNIFLILSLNLFLAPKAFAGDGTSCSSSKSASFGVNEGNGFASQYFSITPIEDVYVKFATNITNSYNSQSVTVYKGDCDSLQYCDFTYLHSSPTTQVTELKANTAYVFECRNLNANEFKIINLSELPKEFVSFSVFNSEGNISTVIDTLSNTINIIVPSNIDITNLQYSYSTLYHNLTTVRLNGEIITSNGVMDFTNLSELVLSDPQNKSTTYNVVAKKVSGLSCGSAINATDGINYGNGLYNEYYKYKATSSDYIQISSGSANTVLVDIYEEECTYSNYISYYTFYEGGSTLLRVVDGKTYYLKFNNLAQSSFTISTVAEVRKEFKSFSIYADSKSYTAVIDTVANTLTFDIPTDLDLRSTYLNYETEVKQYLEVLSNGLTLTHGHYLDFSTIKTIEIREQTGKQAFYSVILNHVKGLSCGTSTIVGEGDIVGSGNGYQIYSFTPSKKGYIEISSNSNSYSWISIFKNDCDGDDIIFNGGISSYSASTILVDPNNTYYISTQLNGGEVMHLEYLKDAPKEFSSFEVKQLETSYLAKVDTLFNTLSFTVPSNIDLSDMKCNFSTVGYLETYVNVNNTNILSGESIDLSKTDTILIVDANSESEIYTIFYTRADGISCNSAQIAKEGLNKGNGQYEQFFWLTPTKSGVISISSSTGWLNLDTYSGTCGALVEEFHTYANYNQPSLLKVTTGSNYLIRSQHLEHGSLIIKYEDEILKELSYMNIEVGNSDFYASVDQENKIITLNVPSDIDLASVKASFQLKVPIFTQVYLNGKVSLENEPCDLREITSIEVKDINGNSANYNLVLNKVLGLSCSAPIIANEGKTKVASDYTYFKFISSKDGFVNVAPLLNWGSIEVYSGNCNYSNLISSGSATKDQPLLIQVKKDLAYLIRTNGLYNDSLNISYITEIPKKINSFTIRTDIVNYYSTTPSIIDHETKKITFIVPSDFDLSNVTYSVSLENSKYSDVSYNGSIIPLSGNMNFNLSSSIKVMDVKGEFITYSLVIVRMDGMSCGSSLELKIDSTHTIGYSNNFFKYIPDNDGYICVLTSNIYNLEIRQGSCGSLQSVPVDSYYMGEEKSVFKVERGETYYLSCRSNPVGTLKLKLSKSVPLEFRSFNITFNGNSYVAKVDTVANKLTLNIPSDIDERKINYSYSLESSSYSKMAHNDVIQSIYGTIDISSNKLFTISDTHQNSEIYSIVLVKHEGMSCRTSIEAKVGKTLVNGDYYKFIPSKTAYYSIYSTDSGYAYLHSGECDNLRSIASKYADQNSPFIVRGVEGMPLTIRFSHFNKGYLVIEALSEIPKEFTNFYFRDGSSFDLDFPALIDTVLNTITVSVPTDFDLSNVSYSFGKTGDNFTQVRSENSILETSGTFNFASRESISIVDVNGYSETYSLAFNRSEGLSCTTALPISEGITVGNGRQYQFYTFTPAKDGAIELTPSNNGLVRFMVGIGECDALKNINSSAYSFMSELAIPVTSGINYTIAVIGLFDNELLLRYLNPIPKEFTSFSVKEKQFNETFYGGTYYKSEIDTISNRIVVGIPFGTQFKSVQCSFEVTAKMCNRVSLNGSILDISNGYFLNDSNVVSIIDVYGEIATYSLVLKEMNGVDCSQATIATEGLTQGNGMPSQYFSFTAQQSGYINISGSVSEPHFQVFRGICGNLVDTAEGYKSVSIYVNSGDSYVIIAENLLRNNLSIDFVGSLTKEFTYFAVMDEKSNNYYSAQIDTLKNSISIVVPHDFNSVDLLFFFATTCNAECEVLAKGVEITNYDTLNFNDIKEFQIVDSALNSVTYTFNLYKISETTFLSFNIPGQVSSTIDLATQNVDILMPDGTTLNRLTPSFTASKGATVKINSTPQISGITTNNFYMKRTYTVSGSDGILSTNWTVSVSNGATPLETHKDDSFLLEVYPNPSSGVFHVKMGDISNKLVQLKIFTSTGHLIWIKSIDNSPSEFIDVDLNGYPSGIYFLQASDDRNSKTEKIIVK